MVRMSDFCYWDFPIIELAGKTMGIVGFGSIGQQTARIASAMGMKVIVWSRTRKEAEMGFPFVWADSLQELLGQSDVVSLHCPLFPQTHHMINKETLSFMKPDGILINTARGALVDEKALADALREKGSPAPLWMYWNRSRQRRIIRCSYWKTA